MRETQLTAKIVKQLCTFSRCYARKRHGSAYCVGEPDIYACYGGGSVFIEVKMLDGALSTLQAIMLQRWQDAGALCVLAVWDPEQKALAIFHNKNWVAYTGPVKARVLRWENKDYFNVRLAQLDEALEGMYADAC